MGKKSKKNRRGVVYSTNPDFNYSYGDNEETAAVDPGKQSLHVFIEKKGRRGKVVTLIEGFRGPQEDMDKLASRLKSSCGIGGSAKDGQIILQGNLRNKVRDLLKSWGFGVI
jgi:translation initiation factor 1